MRRALALLVSVCLTLLIAAPVAAGGKPEKNRLEPTYLGPEVFGDACGFPVDLLDLSGHANELIFPVDANGDQRYVNNGGFTSTLTNLDSGKQITITFHGYVELVFRADGTVDVSTSGGVLHWFTSADVLSPFGQGIFLTHGRVTYVVDADTFLVVMPGTVKGRVTDICAALAE
jgi:hypothetical protein